TKADDPVAGSSPGSGFAVPGFTAPANDADGLAGWIEFPGTGTQLLENVDDADLGLPRDLNDDGKVDAANHAANYRLLPVRVVVAWHGKAGDRTLALVTVLADL